MSTTAGLARRLRDQAAHFDTGSNMEQLLTDAANAIYATAGALQGLVSVLDEQRPALREAKIAHAPELSAAREALSLVSPATPKEGNQ